VLNGCVNQKAAEGVGESKPDKFVVVCEGQRSRNTANCVLDDVVHRRYQGVLGFLNMGFAVHMQM
jgi:hypothetical protein